MLQIIRTGNPRRKPRRFSQLQLQLQLLGSAKSHFSATAPSDIYCVGIAQSVISKASSLFPNSNKGKVHNFSSGHSLKHLLWDISDTIPDVARRFRRFHSLQPEHVLQILLGFQFESRMVNVKKEKVESLWGIFNFASKQGIWFKHLPKSCEAMASLLLESGMFTEVQLLLLEVERQGVSLDGNVIYDGLIRGYVEASKPERAGLVYEKMREQGLVPSSMCYHGLLDLLVRMKRSELAFRVCLDMVELQVVLDDGLNAGLENVCRLLCADEMIKEARRLVKKAMGLGFKPSSFLVNEIARGYCSKHDYDDSLQFFAKMKCAPSVLTGNKIIWSLCHNFDAESANLFRLEMERLGFIPDDKSFGILIGQCCKERNLRDAFLHFSEMVSRGLKPGILSYNALIGGMLKEGMWDQAGVILDEMMESGVTPGLSTFRILLAGYFKARQFEEAKKIVHKMGEIGLVAPSPVEDPLSKAFLILGFNPASVRFKRDNGSSFLKTEFLDQLGNGLYLDADIKEYRNKVKQILEDSLIPDFNVLLRKELDDGNFRDAFSIVDEMVRWGQEPTPDVFAILVKGLCGSRSHIRLCNFLIEKVPRFLNLLNEEVLNCLVQAYCKIGLAETARIIFGQMIQRSMRIDSSSFTALITALCKKGNLSGNLHECWDISQNSKWLPQLKDFSRVIEGIGYQGMLMEAVELLEKLLVFHSTSRPEIYRIFLEKLSVTGLASIACLVVEELEKHGFIVDDSTYSNLVAGLYKDRKYADAYKIFNHALTRSLVLGSDGYVILIPQLCIVSVQKANLLEETELGKDLSSSFSFVRALHRRFGVRGKVEEAASLLQGILSNGLLPNPEICEILFQGYCKASNMRKAKELLGILMRKSLTLSIPSYRNWVRLMCRESRYDMALNMKDLITARETESDILVIYYNILVFYLLSAGNRYLTRSILNEMEAKSLPFNDATYNFLIHGFAKCKDVSSSIYYMSAMVSMDLQPSSSSLRSLVSCLLKQDDSSKVLDLSRQMESKGWVHGSILQNAVAEQFLVQNKFEEAENFLDRVVDKGLAPDIINYDRLIKLFCWYGRTSKAVDLLNIMLKKRNLPNPRSYDCIIQSLCKRNRVNEALDFLAELLDIDDGKPSIETWSLLVHKLCQEGRTSEAEELLHAMLAAGEIPGREMYSCVIESHRSENNLRNASEVMGMMQRSGYDPDFESHWSLISNLSTSSMGKEDDNDKTSGGFLTGLLFGSGHPVRTRSNPNKINKPL
ncbi:unnamed protein product [Linum tenue]|uniref:Pentatricopeptide repeat-containing protein n=1 Tax=Linum tenue TaxID=586396 RepID=A0AAV0N627_9ROSI|nr:unnamed protein product [Linum tenue]